MISKPTKMQKQGTIKDRVATELWWKIILEVEESLSPEIKHKISPQYLRGLQKIHGNKSKNCFSPVWVSVNNEPVGFVRAPWSWTPSPYGSWSSQRHTPPPPAIWPSYLRNKMTFLRYTGTFALIIYISNIQGTKKYSAVMYYLNTVQSSRTYVHHSRENTLVCSN